MSSAPMSTAATPQELDAPSKGQPRRERGGTDAPRGSAESAALQQIRGRLQPPPLGRLGRGLVYGTGLFLFRPILWICRRLIGWERRAELGYRDGVLQVDRELVVLGSTLRRERERLPASRLVSAATQQVTAPEPLALGALVLAVALVWGLWQIVDGIYGRSGGLVGMGLGAIAAGAVVDLALFWVASRLPSLRSGGVVVRATDGREISVLGLSEAAADRLAAAITEDLR